MYPGRYTLEPVYIVCTQRKVFQYVTNSIVPSCNIVFIKFLLSFSILEFDLFYITLIIIC